MASPASSLTPSPESAPSDVAVTSHGATPSGTRRGSSRWLLVAALLACAGSAFVAQRVDAGSRAEAAARADETARMEQALIDAWNTEDEAGREHADGARESADEVEDGFGEGSPSRRLVEAASGADRTGADRATARMRAASAPGAGSSDSTDAAGRRTRSVHEDGNAGVERARKRLDTGLRPIPAAPGRAAPAAQADAGDLHFDWTYQVGGNAYAVNTTVSIAPGAPGEGLRRDAVITTMDSNGRTLVSYHGTAYRDANGLIHIDARNAPVSGPLARNWSPDSIAVDEYGQVHTQDDYNRTGGGWVTP